MLARVFTNYVYMPCRILSDTAIFMYFLLYP